MGQLCLMGRYVTGRIYLRAAGTSFNGSTFTCYKAHAPVATLAWLIPQSAGTLTRNPPCRTLVRQPKI